MSVGRIGRLECDFILRNHELDYFYIQVAYKILLSRETEEREYRPLEAILQFCLNNMSEIHLIL